MTERTTIPAQKVGEYEIKHGVYDNGCEFLLVSDREAMFIGWPATLHVFPRPLIIHEPRGPGGTWMSDIPSEVIQMHEEFARYARGRVLIGGLGLGIAARMARANPRVESVTVVELSPEVIRMVSPSTPGVEIIRGSIFDFVRSLQPGQLAAGILTACGRRRSRSRILRAPQCGFSFLAETIAASTCW